MYGHKISKVASLHSDTDTKKVVLGVHDVRLLVRSRFFGLMDSLGNTRATCYRTVYNVL